jgi:hypothetical protein
LRCAGTGCHSGFKSGPKFQTAALRKYTDGLRALVLS